MVALIVAAILALTAATGGMLYASDGAGPGSALYGVDRSVERVRVKMAATPEARTQLLMALAEERLQEASDTADDGDEDGVDEAVDEYFATLDELLAAMLESGEVDEEELAALLATLAGYEEQIQAILDGLEVPADEDLDDEVGEDEDLEGEDELDQDEDEELDDDEDAQACVGADPHPVGMALAEQYEVEYDEVMTWFCDGFGFGEIMHALSTSEGSDGDYTPEELLEMKETSGGWGQVWQELGLIGKGRNPHTVDGDEPADDLDDEVEDELIEPEEGDDRPGNGNGNGPPMVPPGQSGENPGNGNDGDRVSPGQADRDDDRQPGPPEHSNAGGNGNGRGNGRDK